VRGHIGICIGLYHKRQPTVDFKINVPSALHSFRTTGIAPEGPWDLTSVAMVYSQGSGIKHKEKDCYML
jgi:hypothetical protein